MTDLNELQYGNPPIDLLQFINGKTYLDILFAECSHNNFPTNSSNIVKQELNDMVIKSMHLQGDPEAQKRYRSYDQSIISTYHQCTFENPADTKNYQDTIKDIFEDVLPLVFKLKQYFQRPRPFQLAHYYKIKLFPLPSNNADSPSYPCLHACMGRVLAGVFINHHPDASKFFNETGMDIGYSRIYMGLNFQSSVDAGMRVAEKILMNREFMVKYKI